MLMPADGPPRETEWGGGGDPDSHMLLERER